MIGIYKFTSKTTKLSYIGKSIDIYSRYNQHLKDYKRIKTKFYKAIKIFGIDDFDFEIIEKCEKDQLNEREIYWISYYNSYYNGYNMTLGGEGVSPEVCGYHIAQYSLDGEYITDYISIREAERLLNINNICRVVNQDSLSAGGYLWKKVNDERSITEWVDKYNNKKSITGKVKVKQFDLNHNFIKEYDSIIDAAHSVGLSSKSTITDACKNPTHTAGGYYWEYSLKPDNIKQTNRYNARKVDKYDLNNNYIYTYESIAEAARQNNIKNASNIILVCNKKRKSCGGFKWKYSDNF